MFILFIPFVHIGRHGSPKGRHFGKDANTLAKRKKRSKVLCARFTIPSRKTGVHGASVAESCCCCCCTNDDQSMALTVCKRGSTTDGH
jgi:hypothetical protein